MPTAPNANSDVCAPADAAAVAGVGAPAAARAATATLDEESRRLLWRCRRGMKELDVLLERFARRELPGATAEQRHTLTRLLELPDPVLVDYLLGQAIPPDAELIALVHRISIQATADRATAADRATSGAQTAASAPADATP